MSEEKQPKTTWQAEIEKFQKESMVKLKGLSEYGLGQTLGTCLEDLSKKLSTLEAENSSFSTNEDAAPNKEERKKALVRGAILEANKIFFQKLNQAAEMPVNTDEAKWAKREAVLDASTEYQKNLDECGRLSDPNWYTVQMALACGFMTTMSIVWSAAFTLFVAAIAPNYVIGVAVELAVFVLIVLAMEIHALHYEKTRLDAKMKGALNASEPTPRDLLLQDAKSNSAWDLSMPFSPDPANRIAYMEPCREMIFESRSKIGERSTTVFGDNAPSRLAGDKIATQMQCAAAFTPLEQATAVFNNAYQYAKSFWSSEEPVNASTQEEQLQSLQSNHGKSGGLAS
jgi:hypothetical protein